MSSLEAKPHENSFGVPREVTTDRPVVFEELNEDLKIYSRIHGDLGSN